MTGATGDIVQLDVCRPLTDLAPACDGADVLVVLRAGRLPLGQLVIPAAALPVPAARLRQLVADAIAPALGQRVLGLHVGPQSSGRQGSRTSPSPPPASACLVTSPVGALAQAAVHPPYPDAESFTVIVCTRNRPAQLQGALEALQRLAPAPAEVVVVDNAPQDDSTRRVVAAFPGVRYVLEPAPGLSVARNTGVRASRTELLAFTDDDARPSPDWLAHLAAAFADPDVGVVTGLVLPAALDNDGARAFEGMGGFGRGFLQRDHDLVFFDGTRRRGVPVWRLGAGADMAVRRRVLELVGPFDERLGAGASGCSEDSELWYRVLAAGFSCRYEPAAEVTHLHREDLRAVRRQARAYMRGHVTALAVQFSRHRQVGELRRAAAHLPLSYGRRLLRTAVRRRTVSDPLLPAELAGYLAGLVGGARVLLAGRAGLGSGAGGRAPLRTVLAQNPFPHPRTEGFYFREKMRAIVRVAPDDRVRRVLEVGGGQSGLTSILYPGADVVSVDLEPVFGRSSANRRARQVFLAADATRLPFQDASFDAVTYFDVLEHIPDDRRAVEEALRVLAPGGSLLVTSPNESWRFPYHAPFRTICPPDTEVMAEWGHVRRGYTTAQLEALVGRPVTRWATFIGPVTVLAHDLAFSRLPGRVRRGLITALAPVVWTAYALHRPHSPGTETAWWWRMPVRTAAGP